MKFSINYRYIAFLLPHLRYVATLPRQCDNALPVAHASRDIVYSFSSRQQRLSFDLICSHRTVPTSIRSTTGYQPSSSSESVTRRLLHWRTEAAFATRLAL